MAEEPEEETLKYHVLDLVLAYVTTYRMHRSGCVPPSRILCASLPHPAQRLGPLARFDTASLRQADGRVSPMCDSMHKGARCGRG